jgi:3-dehydroquinate synthetase
LEDSDRELAFEVSVIIPCKTIDKYVERCVGYLEAMYPEVEIIVIPDSVCPGFPAGKRNMGMNLAKGNVYAFIDSDAYPSPEWLDVALFYLRINIQKKVDWLPLIIDSLKVKQRIVLEDPLEKGVRKALNFGHTIGHGIEGVRLHKENYLLHGEAIAIGMVTEAWLSYFKGFLSEDTFTSIIYFLKRTFDLQPIEIELFDDFISLMKNDKKNETDQIHFSIIGPVGIMHHDVVFEESFVKKALEIYNHILLQ